MITADQLAMLCIGIPSKDAEAWAPALDAACVANEINTPRRMRHFMAQLCTETGGFRTFIENLNYSAGRLAAVWPSRFPTLAAAQPYAMNPRALADKVYGGRGGNTEADDGYNFRGRGPIMRTFRGGYSQAQAITGQPVVDQPDLLLQPTIGAADAAGFWSHHGLNAIADDDDGERCYADFLAGVAANEDHDVVHETRIVNGGLIGLADREHWLVRAAAIWPDAI